MIPVRPGVRRRRGKPHPQLAQLQRTWYFFRRNALGMVGLGVILSITGAALYAVTINLPWTSMPEWCATDYGPGNPASGYPAAFTQDCPTGPTHPVICTYEQTPPPNANQFCGGRWYQAVVRGGVPFPGIIAPTLTLSPFATGPMPLGGLTTSSGLQTPIYDIAGALARGSDWSLFFSVMIVGIGATMGLLVGAIAGFYGGRFDDVLMRLVDIFLSIPTLLFVIVVISVIAVNLRSVSGSVGNLRILALILGFAAVWWPFYARIVRGQVLSVREQKYVEAATASGAPRHRILLRHIIPNSVYPVFIQFSLDVGTIPLLLGALAFLGFSRVIYPSYPFPEWGTLSALSVTDLQGDFLNSCYTAATGCVIPWWQLLFPGLAVLFFALSVNLFADGLRDALDPRLRR